MYLTLYYENHKLHKVNIFNNIEFLRQKKYKPNDFGSGFDIIEVIRSKKLDIAQITIDNKLIILYNIFKMGMQQF